MYRSGSSYNANPDGSNFFDNGRGMTRFTPASVKVEEPDNAGVKIEETSSQVPVRIDSTGEEGIKQETGYNSRL